MLSFKFPSRKKIISIVKTFRETDNLFFSLYARGSQVLTHSNLKTFSTSIKITPSLCNTE